MTARVFIHPAVHRDPAKTQVLATTMQEWGYDTTKMAVYDPPSVRRSNVHELVRDLGQVENGHLFSRMDGEQFVHQDPNPYQPRRA